MRRRLILFLIIFGISLTLLAIFVQGDDLLREYSTQTIGVQDVEGGADMITIPSGANQFRLDKRVERIEMPVGEEKTYVDDAGVTQTYQSAIMILPDTELFDDSIHSQKPLLSVYGSGPDDLTAQVRSGMATIYTYSPVDFASLDREDLPDVKSVFLTGEVIAEIAGSDGQPGLELRTEQLELEVPPGWDAERGLPPVECPQALEIRRTDGSLILRGSSGEFDAAGQRVLIHPPVEVIALVDGLGERFDRLVEKGVARRSPLVVHCDGDLEYTWTTPEDAPEGAERTRSLDRSIGDGEITLRDAVRAEQGDQWMHSEFLRFVIVREDGAAPADADPEAPAPRSRYRVSEMEAYDHRGSEAVRFGLMSGTGSTGKLHVREEDGLLEFLDHAHFEDLCIGEGEDRTVLDLLEASERLSLQRVQPPGGPDRIEVRLVGEAKVDVRDLALAEAGQIDLDLVGRAGSAAEDPVDDGGREWTPRRLQLREDASLELKRPGEPRGTATADRIDYHGEAGGRRVVRLVGQSHCVVDGTTLDGALKHADVRAPSMEWSWIEPERGDPLAATGRERAAALDFRLEVPELQEATFTVDGLAMEQLRGLDRTSKEEAAPPGDASTLATTLKVFPDEPCRLDAGANEVHLLGRCEVRSLREEVLLQSLRAGRFDASFPSETERRVRAEGRVVVLSPEDGATLRGDRVELDEILVAHGMPAVLELRFDPGSPPTVLEAGELSLDPATGSLRARRQGGDLVHLWGPAGRLARALPRRDGEEPDADPEPEPNPPADPAAPPSRADLWCEQLTAVQAPKGAEDDEPGARDPDGGTAAREDLPFSVLLAEGSVRLLQDDGTELRGDRVDVRAATQTVRVDGTPALLLRTPVTGAASDERAEAEWLELSLVDEVPVLRVAPRAVLEFFLPASKLRDDLAEGEGPDALRRVQVLTTEITVVDDTILTTDGGIETIVHLRDDRIRASSQRLEVVFDRSPLRGGVPIRAYARREVHLEHPWFECRGAVLSFDFVDEWLELKSGIERCEVIGAAEFLPLQLEGMDATFRTLKCRLRSPSGARPGLSLDELFVEDLTLRPRGAGIAGGGLPPEETARADRE